MEIIKLSVMIPRVLWHAGLAYGYVCIDNAMFDHGKDCKLVSKLHAYHMNRANAIASEYQAEGRT